MSKRDQYDHAIHFYRIDITITKNNYWNGNWRERYYDVVKQYIANQLSSFPRADQHWMHVRMYARLVNLAKQILHVILSKDLLQAPTSAPKHPPPPPNYKKEKKMLTYSQVDTEVGHHKKQLGVLINP